MYRSLLTVGLRRGDVSYSLYRANFFEYPREAALLRASELNRISGVPLPNRFTSIVLSDTTAPMILGEPLIALITSRRRGSSLENGASI